MIVQAENSSHYAAVHTLHAEAFPSPAEANLVEQLRRDGDAILSLVAIEQTHVIAHVMFSKMSAPFRALGLAPVSVAPDRRRRGVAAALIHEGIAHAKATGWNGIFVLGNPAYYSRFGFRVDTAALFDSAYAGPHFMLLALDGAVIAAHSGRVDYAPAFSALG
jgi:putative acetyltransferase